MPTTTETEARKIYLIYSAIEAIYLEESRSKALLWTAALESILFGVDLPPDEFLSTLTWMAFDHIVILEAIVNTNISTFDAIGIDKVRQHVLRRWRFRLDPDDIKIRIRELINGGLIDFEDGDLLLLSDTTMAFLKFVGWR